MKLAIGTAQFGLDYGFLKKIFRVNFNYLFNIFYFI